MTETAPAASLAAAPAGPVLELHGISKTFAGVGVLHGVELAVYPGQVMGLVGENGAGTSTLMRIVTGIYGTDPGGVIHFGGREVHFASARQSIDAGVAMIHQDLNLLPDLTVAENLLLGREPLNRFGLIDRPAMQAQALALLAVVHQQIDPASSVGSLSVAQQQMVEIARALSLDARLIIMDEPTDELTGVETAVLFEAIRHLRAQGKAVVYISHRLAEIFAICDVVTVLRDGHKVFSGPVAGLDEATLIHHMVGREITDQYPYLPATAGAVALRVRGLTAPGISDISFEVRAGEVVGFAGLMGAGSSELGKAIYGDVPVHAGSVELQGRPVRLRSPQDGVRAGIAYLPEDRKAEGLIQAHSVRTNMSLAALPRFDRGLGLVDRHREDEAVAGYISAFAIKSQGAQAEVATLSGGNQQKVSLAKALMTEPRVLILAEPTRGVDVGARREIYSLINELKAKGMAIVLISSDMPELLGIADRILVLSRGHLTGTFEHGRATQEAILERALA